MTLKRFDSEVPWHRESLTDCINPMKRRRTFPFRQTVLRSKRFHLKCSSGKVFLEGVDLSEEKTLPLPQTLTLLTRPSVAERIKQMTLLI